MERLSGATLYFLSANKKKTQKNSLTDQIVRKLGGSVTSRLQDATHALWISNGENYTQCVDSSLAKSLCIPIVDANRWLERISNIQSGEHWSDIDCDEYVPQFIGRRDDLMSESLSQTLDILSQEDPDFLENNAFDHQSSEAKP